MSVGFWILAGFGLVLLGLLFYWVFVVTEGAYLGPKVVAWTYDLAARKYDTIKQFSALDDAWLLSGPMMLRLRDVNGPLVLDVATGTGRFPLALLNHSKFQGFVVGVDLAHKMLQHAEHKLAAHTGRYALIWQDAQRLPFPDETFDAVSCLEALEFTPDPQQILTEMARVLRPGGAFLVTNRVNWERKLMPGKAFTDDEIRAMLEEAGLLRIEIRPWQVYYDLVWAFKRDEPSRLGHATRTLPDILCCPACQATPLVEERDHMTCSQCGAAYAIRDGILDLARPAFAR